MTFLSSHYGFDLFAVGWFVLVWMGYGVYSSKRGKSKACLSNTLDMYREDWMRRVLMRENRITDTSAIGNLERNAAFFASSSLLVIAGILTAIGYTDKAMTVFNDLKLYSATDKLLWELRLVVLLVVFVYAFFKFSWAMRQYNFVAVMIGSAPLPVEKKVTPAARNAFAKSAARVANLAGDTFNLGLRSYYYALAVLTWFIHPLAFVLATTVIAVILFKREFHSRALRALRSGKEFDEP